MATLQPSSLEPGCSSNDPQRNLPPFVPVADRDFQWGRLGGDDFAHALHSAYSEIVHWRRNVFLVPSGSAGKAFVRELTRLFLAFAQASSVESVAFEAIMVASVLLLQKPHSSSKAKDHASALERRLCAWNEGDLDGLLREGRTIQAQLQHASQMRASVRRAEDTGHSARIFAKLMLEGKVHAALRHLSDNHSGGVLSLDATPTDNGPSVRDILRNKHPSPGEMNSDAFIFTPDASPVEVHPVLFEGLTGNTIRSAALRTQGAAGPSGIDAAGWRRLCTSFHRASEDLCSAVAAAARRLCSTFVDPDAVFAFTACRLIPLDKRPGVRPIGICEVVRRIVGKAVMSVVGQDVLKAAGPLQLCAGQEAGCEAAVHAMRQVFASATADGILLVDASNAFNNLNRRVALQNIQFLCPSISTLLINCYRGNALLFVGGEVMLSEEGTTQGDPLAMAMFALASVPLIQKVATAEATQAWFADDASCGGHLRALRAWWDKLVRYGPLFGYLPNASKTSLVVKPEHLSAAREMFSDTEICITSEGKRHLGAGLGTESFVDEFVTSKVAEWVAEVLRLSEFAKSQPHAAFTALTHGLIGRWVHLCRVSVCQTDLLQPLEDAVQRVLLPALTGQPAFGNCTRELLALPARLGGLGVINATTLPAAQHPASLKVCAPLVKLILDQGGDILPAQSQQRHIRHQLAKDRDTFQQARAKELVSHLPPPLQRCVLAAQEKGASAWITALPLTAHGFSLHKGAFRDSLCLRYGWPLALVPNTCACGAKFDSNHALICRYGGYPTIRHNEIRDLTASLLKQVCTNVSTEPHLQPLTGESLPPSANTQDDARLDVRARGFWSNNGAEAFFDVRVFHPFASSYRGSSLSTLYRQHERRKKAEYGRRVLDIERGSFTPLVFTTTGGMGREANVFFKRLASLLSIKREEPYSTVMRWLRCRLSFSLVRSALLCIRGSRSGAPSSVSPDTLLDSNTISLAVAESNLTKA